MDKASIIKDAIGYIQQLQEQEQMLLSEISELELSNEFTDIIYGMEQDDVAKISPGWPLAPGSTFMPSIEVSEVRLICLGLSYVYIPALTSCQGVLIIISLGTYWGEDYKALLI